MSNLQVSTPVDRRSASPLWGLRAPAQTRLNEALQSFRTISLQELDGVALLNRFDTKFILPTTRLIALLHNLRSSYRILSITGRRVHPYRTLYFDTPGFDLFHQQVTGRPEIYKVRLREYLDTRLAYLEIKHKNRKGRTEKTRLPISPFECLGQDVQDFVGGVMSLSGRDLQPKICNTFNRITLAFTECLPTLASMRAERVTLDLDLGFFNAQGELLLDGIAVAEVKQDSLRQKSAFMTEMRRQGVRPTSFSKYCFGVSQLYSTVKGNSQKEKVLLINKYQHGGQRVCCA
jgi:hypothetical protein